MASGSSGFSLCFLHLMNIADLSSTGTGEQEKAIPVTSLKVGDEVLLRVQGAARHTGIEIQEFIVENWRRKMTYFCSEICSRHFWIWWKRRLLSLSKPWICIWRLQTNGWLDVIMQMQLWGLYFILSEMCLQSIFYHYFFIPWNDLCTLPKNSSILKNTLGLICSLEMRKKLTVHLIIQQITAMNSAPFNKLNIILYGHMTSEIVSRKPILKDSYSWEKILFSPFIFWSYQLENHKQYGLFPFCTKQYNVIAWSDY